MSVFTRTADSCSPPLRGGGRWGIEKTAPAWIFPPFLAELGPSDKSPGAARARAVSRLTCFPTGQLVHGIFQVAPVLTQISENWIAPPKGLSVKYEKKFKRPDPPCFFILIPKSPRRKLKAFSAFLPFTAIPRKYLKKVILAWLWHTGQPNASV